MLAQQKKLLTVNIADRVFKLKIDSEEEELFLETIKQVNLKIKEFKANFPGLSLQEYLSMAILWLASKQVVQIANKEADATKAITTKLNQWTTLLPF